MKLTIIENIRPNNYFDKMLQPYGTKKEQNCPFQLNNYRRYNKRQLSCPKHLHLNAYF